MHANLLAQSDNLSGAELRAKGTVVGTIASIRVEEMEKIGKPGAKTKRGVFTFSEQGSKPWILNVTNREILKVVFGDGRCGKADVGVPLIALATLDVPAYPADAQPPELAAIPTTDPGSRRLAG